MLLYGTGAVGSLYGGKLAQAGAGVSTVCRSDFKEVSETGIQIKSVFGDYHFKPEAVVKKGGDYSYRPDYVIVATKVLPEIDVAEMIKDSVYPETSIVLLQNGIDIEKSIAARFSNNEIISGLAFVCSSRTGYGQIEHTDYGRLVLGIYPGGISPKVELLAEMFRAAGVPTEAEEDVIAARWKKLIWNAPFNPLSVICSGADTSEMMSDDKIQELSRSIMEEVIQLASADGHPLDMALIEKNITDTIRMKPYKTSMLLDYEAGRPMEVEAILGNAVRIAGKNSIQVPHIKTVYALLDILNKRNLSVKTIPRSHR